ncbi:MAG: hypothetical protein ABS46_06385 [Cytophagaceae bacterium SCN 52-12]|nr:MAG: hypothetical protein ABS46_06385 [Cytophagaceae bacterium SCN 52-12]
MNASSTRLLLIFLLTFCYWLAKGNQVGFGAEQSHIKPSSRVPGHAQVSAADVLQDPAGLAIIGEADEVQGLKKPSFSESSLPTELCLEKFMEASSASHSDTRDRTWAPHSAPVPYYILFCSIRVPHTKA